MKLFYLFLSFLVLTSCATVDSSYKGADAGYAVISLTLDDKDSLFGDAANFNLFELYFANNDAEVDGYKAFSCSKNGFDRPDPDIKDKSSQTFVIVRPLPPGHYRIFSFSLKNVSNFTVSVWNKEAFSIPFEIKPSQYTYLGNYHGISTLEKVLLGSRINGGYIVVSDYKDRDAGLVKIKNPSHTMAVLVSSVPVVELISNPLFIRERKADFTSEQKSN